MRNFSITVCDWIAVILSLPWFQKHKAEKTFFSAAVCFEHEDWQRQNNALCMHTRVCVQAQPVAVALGNWRVELERRVDVLGKINEYKRFADDRWLVSYSEGVTEEEENQLWVSCRMSALEAQPGAGEADPFQQKQEDIKDSAWVTEKW